MDEASHPDPVSLQELQQVLSLSNTEINELIHCHQKFMGSIQRLNGEAQGRIKNEKFKEALVYLGEAQRILEYAASCGKNIDRDVIVCVLHNEACCFQRLWELEKCSNYLEALIFNISSHLKTNTPSPRENQDYLKTSTSISSHLRERLYGKSLSHRLQLSKYHLQFCAINSQLRNHKNSLISAKRSLSIMKDIFIELSSLSQEKNSSLDNNYGHASLLPDEPQSDFESKIEILNGMAGIIDEQDLGMGADRVADYQATVQYFFKKWSLRKLESGNEVISEKLKSFSIGHVMQIKVQSNFGDRASPLSNGTVGPIGDWNNMSEIAVADKNNADYLKIYTLPKVIYLVLLLTSGYFTVATELRLIATEKFKQNQAQRKESPEHIQSQIYHMIAIIIASVYVPYDMMYMRHLLTSYASHYDGAINGDSEETGNMMKKEFDPLGLCQIKKKAKIHGQSAKGEKRSINKSLAFEFAESIKIQDGNNEQNCKNRKISSHNKIFSIKETVNIKDTKKNKKMHLNIGITIGNSTKNKSKGSKEKIRVMSEMPERIHAIINSVQSKDFDGKEKQKDKKKRKNKIKHQSLQKKEKKKKSLSNNSHKTKKEKNSISPSAKQQQKDEYYKSNRKMRNPISNRETYPVSKEKKKERQIEKEISKQKYQNRNSRGLMIASTSSSTFRGLREKKSPPLKKNLDKYYF